MTQPQRLVLDFRTGELVMRVLYRSEDGPSAGLPFSPSFSPGTFPRQEGRGIHR